MFGKKKCWNIVLTICYFLQSTLKSGVRTYTDDGEGGGGGGGYNSTSVGGAGRKRLSMSLLAQFDVLK